MRQGIRPLRLLLAISPLLWALGCLSVSAAAQISFGGPGTSTITDPQAKNTLAGTVVNAVTGEPVRRALVQISFGPQLATTTDSEGHFEFDNLPTGQAAINVRKPGFFSEAELAPPAPSASMVEVGGDAKPLTLKLVPEGILFGHVAAKEGPLEGVAVKVMKWHVVGGRKQWEQRAMAMTDEDGAFRIANLAPGVYYLSAGPSFDRGFRRNSQTPVEGYPEVFYPESTVRDGATPIELAAGQRVQADFSLKSVPLYRVSGILAGAMPGVGISLQFWDPSGYAKPFGVEQQPGKSTFEAHVPEGSYVLAARAGGPGGAPLRADLPINVTGDVANLHLLLSPTATLPVSVKKEAVAPPDSGVVFVTSGLPVSVQLRSSSPMPDPGGWFGYQGDDPTAGMAVRNIAPGKYSVEISANPPWYVASAQCGSVDVFREDLAVTAGAQLPPLEIVLRDDGATLLARVTSAGRPAQGVVLLVPERSRDALRPISASGGSGAQISGLAPGDYNVLALSRIDGLEYTNPDVLGPYLSRAQHVVLEPNQNLEITVELIPADQ